MQEKFKKYYFVGQHVGLLCIFKPMLLQFKFICSVKQHIDTAQQLGVRDICTNKRENIVHKYRQTWKNIYLLTTVRFERFYKKNLSY